eukprot:s304_g11.t1
MPAVDEDKLRFRLRFSSGIAAGTSQYLLRYPTNPTVGSFLEEVRTRFALIRDVELICSIGGFALPPCEPLRRVLRDDEIVTVMACPGKAVAPGGRKRKRTSQQPAPAPPPSHLLVKTCCERALEKAKSTHPTSAIILVWAKMPCGAKRGENWAGFLKTLETGFRFWQS